jgi:Bacterial HORMA domain family 1
MSTSYTFSETTTFTLTHAKYMASKFASDLKRLQRFYGSPSDSEIAEYETEVIELLKEGYFGILTVGFRRNGQWIEPALRYTARDLAGMTSNDDDPGRVRPGADISGASFYLSYAPWRARA